MEQGVTGMLTKLEEWTDFDVDEVVSDLERGDRQILRVRKWEWEVGNEEEGRENNEARLEISPAE